MLIALYTLNLLFVNLVEKIFNHSQLRNLTNMYKVALKYSM